MHDGQRWRVAVMSREKRHWACIDTSEQAGQAQYSRLPEELLEFAAHHNATYARVLLASDVQDMELQLPLDAEPEELQTAVRFEAQESLSLEEPNLRFAAAKASNYAMGANDNVLLLTGFDNALLERYRNFCEEYGLNFTGAGSLEIAALGWTVARKNRLTTPRLLILKEKDAFYAAPAEGDLPFSVTAMPVGHLAGNTGGVDEERLERVARRLGAHGDLPVTVFSCRRLDEGEQSKWADMMKAAPVEWHWMGDAAAKIAAMACASRAGEFDELCPVVGCRPEPRDPYRAGTWLFFAILLVTLLYVGSSWLGLVRRRERIQNRLQRWEELEQARNSAANHVNSLTEQLNNKLDMVRLLRESEVMSETFLQMLNNIAAEVPPHIRIESVRSIERNKYEVKGMSRGGGVSGFIQAISRTENGQDLMVEPGEITEDPSSGDVIFTYYVAVVE